MIYKLGDGLFGLRPVAPAGDCFDEDRVGLDHVSFTLGSRAEIEEAAARLDTLGIKHGGVKDLGASLILEFRDPDNISLELFAPADCGDRPPGRTPAVLRRRDAWDAHDNGPNAAGEGGVDRQYGFVP